MCAYDAGSTFSYVPFFFIAFMVNFYAAYALWGIYGLTGKKRCAAVLHATSLCPKKGRFWMAGLCVNAFGDDCRGELSSCAISICHGLITTVLATHEVRLQIGQWR